MKTRTKQERCMMCGEIGDQTAMRNLTISNRFGSALKTIGPMCKPCIATATQKAVEAEELWMAKTWGA